MKSPVFIFGGLATSLLFFVYAYLSSWSFVYSLLATAVVLIVLQIGYFAYVMLLLRREHRRRARFGPQSDAQRLSNEETPGLASRHQPR